MVRSLHVTSIMHLSHSRGGFCGSIPLTSMDILCSAQYSLTYLYRWPSRCGALIFGNWSNGFAIPLTCCHCCRKIFIIDCPCPGVQRLRTSVSMAPRTASTRMSRQPRPPRSFGPNTGHNFLEIQFCSAVHWCNSQEQRPVLNRAKLRKFKKREIRRIF